MNWKLAGLITVFSFGVHAPPADACGVKLTIKSSAARKAAPRSSNPSEVLLLGSPPRRLERDLKAAGHRVDVASSASEAKKKSYAVVITDADKQGEARSTFSNSIVVVRSSDVGNDLRAVEGQVARKPVAAAADRTVVAARPARQPIAAGPARTPDREMVAAAQPREPVAAQPPTPTPTPPAPTPAPTPTPPRETIAATATKPPEVKAPRETPVVRERPPVREQAAVETTLAQEMYFSTSSSKVGRGHWALTKSVRWLKANPDVNVVIEGHADPVGNPDANMALSQKRAEFVRDQLIAAGIDESRLEVMPYGDTQLKYGKKDRRNRRVSITAK